MRGRFITFEGGEGTGKSTQVKRLADKLRALGLAVLTTREPGGSPGAEAIRHVLLSGVAQPLGAHAEAILFAAARDDHVRQTIAPALAKGDWVICDRFIDSTRVYQGTLGDLDPKFIAGLERIAIGELKPDLTIVLDLPAEIGLQRATQRNSGKPPDRFEKEALDFHRKLRDAYREIAEREPRRCVLIDATPDEATVAQAIFAAVSARLRPAAKSSTIRGAVR